MRRFESGMFKAYDGRIGITCARLACRSALDTVPASRDTIAGRLRFDRRTLVHLLAGEVRSASRHAASTSSTSVMEPVDTISRLGFRKWYEQQLLSAHAALVLCVICMVVVAVCLDSVFAPGPRSEVLGQTVEIVVALVVGWKCWWHYHRAMKQAWRFGESSVCKNCELYGRFVVVTSGKTTPPPSEDDPDPASDVWMNVTCKKCGHHWRMPGKG